MFLKKFFSKLNFISRQTSLIKEVYHLHQPRILKGVVSGNAWRHTSLGRTLDLLENKDKFEELQKIANENLLLWSKKKSQAPQLVEVIQEDWGIATLNATKSYGQTYVVLNMANSIFPGGAVLEGGCAQEENLFHRSTLPLTLLSDKVIYDKKQGSFVYTEEGKLLVQGLGPISVSEQHQLKEHSPHHASDNTYKVMFNPDVQVCFRGPEVLKKTTEEQFFSQESTSDIDNSYLFLNNKDIFPFREMRSAAPYNTMYLDHQHSDAEQILRHRIAAQLDTLILEKQKYVVLGAWGCGAFRNNPFIVSRLYAEEIQKRAHCFEHIIFPILNVGVKINNFEVFNQALSGITLGQIPEKIKSITII